MADVRQSDHSAFEKRNSDRCYLAFARAIGEFGATMLVAGLHETMPIAIYRNAMSGKRAEADALSAVLIAVSFGVMLASRLHNKKLREGKV